MQKNKRDVSQPKQLGTPPHIHTTPFPGVIKAALKEGLVKRKQLLEPGVDLDAFVTRKMYFPAYVPLYQNIFEN